MPPTAGWREGCPPHRDSGPSAHRREEPESWAVWIAMERTPASSLVRLSVLKQDGLARRKLLRMREQDREGRTPRRKRPTQRRKRNFKKEEEE